MEKQTLQQKKLAFLQETVKHYTRDNRSSDDTGCYYSAQDNSMGCAIGRHLSPSLSIKLDGKEFLNNNGVSNAGVYNLLPEELKELGQEFLKSVQILHDRTLFWDAKGLSDEGYNKNDSMIRQIYNGYL